jgi:hypothetical protein
MFNVIIKQVVSDKRDQVLPERQTSIGHYLVMAKYHEFR